MKINNIDDEIAMLILPTVTKLTTTTISLSLMQLFYELKGAISRGFGWYSLKVVTLAYISIKRKCNSFLL